MPLPTRTRESRRRATRTCETRRGGESAGRLGTGGRGPARIVVVVSGVPHTTPWCYASVRDGHVRLTVLTFRWKASHVDTAEQACVQS
eukprot:3015696-Rhodomonas_salina.2